ncbi:MAG: hypothetical protein ABWX62_01750, partial [Microterricola sp.]
MTNVGGAGLPVPGALPAPAGGQQLAAPAEHVVARVRRHGRMLFWPSILLIAVCGAAGFYAGQMDEEWQSIAILAGAALLVLLG